MSVPEEMLGNVFRPFHELLVQQQSGGAKLAKIKKFIQAAESVHKVADALIAIAKEKAQGANFTKFVGQG